MDDERTVSARKRVQRLRELYIHVAIYVVVIGGLTLLNWFINPGFWWVVFPAVIWGVGLAAHAVSVLFEDTLFGPAWQERKTRELLQRDERQGLR